MSFTDTVQRKIAARRAGPSPRAVAATNREAQLRTHAAPLITAIEAMMATLSEDPMFANAMGRPEVGLEPRDDPSVTGGHLTLAGRAAEFRFVLGRESRIALSIYPEMAVLMALQCRDMRYTSASVKGDMAHLDAFMALAEDHIADFIADVALSSAAHVLQPDTPDAFGFGGLTDFWPVCFDIR